MVSAEITVRCMGCKGYGQSVNREITDRNREKIFFTRNSVAALWMLLMTRRPSATMLGMAAKSLFSSTRLPNWLAACAPELKAMEQSACFMASRSLTPSPVMATVCPCFCSAATRRRFFSGVTRPKTVFSDTAREKSSSVSSSDVSI